MDLSFTPEQIMQKATTVRPFTLLQLILNKALPTDENEARQLLNMHLAHLFSLEQQGHISVYGPVMNNDVLKGIVVFNTTDKDAIAELMSTDPYIEAGYFTYQLFDFFTIPGQQIPASS